MRRDDKTPMWPDEFIIITERMKRKNMSNASRLQDRCNRINECLGAPKVDRMKVIVGIEDGPDECIFLYVDGLSQKLNDEQSYMLEMVVTRAWNESRATERNRIKQKIEEII